MANFNAFATSSINTTLVSGMDYINKPQVYNMIFGNYPFQFHLAWMNEWGAPMQKIQGQTCIWQETNMFFDAPVLASAPTVVTAGTRVNAGNVRFTLASSSHTNNGTASTIKAGDTVMLPNYISVRIQSVDKSVDYAHTFMAAALDSTTTAATIAANISAGQQIFYTGSGFAQGGNMSDEGMVQTFQNYSNNIQKFNAHVSVTMEQERSESWNIWNNVVNMTGNKSFTPSADTGAATLTSSDGSANNVVVSSTLNRTVMYQHYLRETSMMFGGYGAASNPSLVDAQGKTGGVMYGFLPMIETNGMDLYWNGALTVTWFNQLENAARTNLAGNMMKGLLGQGYQQALNSFLNEFGKNGGIIYNQATGDFSEEGKAIDAYFTKFRVSTFTFHVTGLNAFNHPKAGGAPGYMYKDCAVFFPDVVYDGKNGTQGKPLQMVYLDQPKTKYGSGGDWYFVQTGTYADIPTTRDGGSRVYDIYSDVSLKAYGTRNAFFVKPE